MLARVRKGNPCIMLVGMYIGTDNGFLKKLKLDPPYDPVNALQDKSKDKTNKQKKKNPLTQKDTWTPTFMAAVFIIMQITAKIRMQSEWPSTDEQIKKMW